MAKKNFEQSMKQLEKIVQELESGDLPLEKAIKKFEEALTVELRLQLSLSTSIA